jgi:uncharacterized protein (TIGR02453 family)
MADNFLGFPIAGLEFLHQLKLNNSREWFLEHKKEYVELLLNPSQLFVASLGDRLKKLSPGIQYDLRTNGSGSILRINRDIRFSKDKNPYHSYMRIVFWEGNLKKMENSGIYIGIEYDGAQIYVGQHGFDSSHLKTFRSAVVDENLGANLENKIRLIQKKGDYEIGGEHYKRIPSGFDKDHPRANYLKYNSFYSKSKIIEPAIIQSPAFIEKCFTEITNMYPLHSWLVSTWKLFEM